MRITEAMRSMIKTMDRHIDATPEEKLKLLFSGTYRIYIARWVWVHHGAERIEILNGLLNKNETTWSKETHRKAVELRKFLKIIYRVGRSTRVPLYLFSLKKPSGQLVSYYLRESCNHLVLGFEEIHDVMVGANHAIEIQYHLGRDRLIEWLALYFREPDLPLQFCCAGLLGKEDWKAIQQLTSGSE